MVPGILDIDGAGLSAEDELARQVIRRILPALRGLLAEVQSLSVTWNTPANDVPGKIAAAYVNGEPLAGYSPKAWDEWGQAFVAIMIAINMPVTVQYGDGTTADKSPAEIVATRYVAQ